MLLMRLWIAARFRESMKNPVLIMVLDGWEAAISTEKSRNTMTLKRHTNRRVAPVLPGLMREGRSQPRPRRKGEIT